ncbi:hypothetical protein [Dethiosulfatarculus sandiegensis]|uniref:hypothetical protein n=1 Tax=Dethiosulfatarculus sandiegensis TaxID=1429043 RepID=UPI0012E1D72A|nr:hypothetical protein [Dethiosulfatarculus sandiegensis]
MPGRLSKSALTGTPVQQAFFPEIYQNKTAFSKLCSWSALFLVGQSFHPFPAKQEQTVAGLFDSAPFSGTF